MLIISEEQMVIADEIARKNFHQRLMGYLRDVLPEETDNMPDSKLLAYISEQDQVAGEHEITSEQGVAKWVCLSFGLGKDFYQESSIKFFFDTPGLPDRESKLIILVDCLYARNKNPNIKIETVFVGHGYPVMES